MLQEARMFSSCAVRDVTVAQEFYAGTLGLEAREEHGMLWVEGSGARMLFYPKPGHKPAEHTVLNFVVADLDATVDALTAKGVEFERYGGEIKTDLKGIHRGNPNVAWFRDPSGNILAVMEEMR